jgi:hypothetical protein
MSENGQLAFKAIVYGASQVMSHIPTLGVPSELTLHLPTLPGSDCINWAQVCFCGLRLADIHSICMSMGLSIDRV